MPSVCQCRWVRNSLWYLAEQDRQVCCGLGWWSDTVAFLNDIGQIRTSNEADIPNASRCSHPIEDGGWDAPSIQLGRIHRNCFVHVRMYSTDRATSEHTRSHFHVASTFARFMHPEFDNDKILYLRKMQIYVMTMSHSGINGFPKTTPILELKRVQNQKGLCELKSSANDSPRFP